jgi:hypothetical protein
MWVPLPRSLTTDGRQSPADGSLRHRTLRDGVASSDDAPARSQVQIHLGKQGRSASPERRAKCRTG